MVDDVTNLFSLVKRISVNESELKRVAMLEQTTRSTSESRFIPYFFFRTFTAKLFVRVSARN